jgi:hypothetical protein
LYCANDLDGDLLPRLEMSCLDDLAERSLSQETNDFIWLSAKHSEIGDTTYTFLR